MYVCDTTCSKRKMNGDKSLHNRSANDQLIIGNIMPGCHSLRMPYYMPDICAGAWIPGRRYNCKSLMTLVDDGFE